MESEMESIPDSKEKEKGRVQRVLSGKERVRMSEIKLKPCPFCGTLPYTSVDKVSAEKIEVSIQCDNPDCGALIKFKIKTKNGFLNFDEVVNGCNEAVETWNGRAEDNGQNTESRQ